jgi:hypothetical protein
MCPGLHLWHHRYAPIARYGHSGQAHCTGVALADGCNRQAVFLAVLCYPIEARERLRGEEQGLR